VGQRLEPDRAVLACRVVETDEFARWCRRCGCEGGPWDTVTRRLAHEPLGWRPTTLLSWNTTKGAVLAEVKRALINDPTRLDGVRVIGVDEHAWRHTRRGAIKPPPAAASRCARRSIASAYPQ
jgi:hypothetical protein